MQDVSAQEQCGRIGVLNRVEATRGLLGDGVKAGVVGHARFRDEAISELFCGASRRAPFAQILLKLRDVGVVARLSGHRHQTGAVLTWGCGYRIRSTAALGEEQRGNRCRDGDSCHVHLRFQGLLRRSGVDGCWGAAGINPRLRVWGAEEQVYRSR